MALTERLALLITADTGTAIKGLQNLERQADKSLGTTEERSKRLASGFQKAGVGMVATGGLIVGGLLHAAKASEDANLSNVKLQNTLQNMPKLAGETADGFTKLATAIQAKTAADADAIVEGEALLGTFNLTGDQIKGITPLVVDYARKFGTDIPTAAIQVGKALDGQIGALKRNGVSIDETLYKTDRYTAVQKALSDQVGGFAEAEGKTFAGSLERLKNQIGDLEEGVGVGAVNAFQKLLTPLVSVTEAAGKLSPGLQSAVGEVAAFTSVGLLAGGAALAAAGQFLKWKNTVAELETSGSKLAPVLGGLGTALKVLPFAAAAFGAYEFGKSLNGLKGDVKALSRETDTELLAAFRKVGVEGLVSLGIFQKTAEENIGTAKRWRDAIADTGANVSKLDAIIQAETKAQQQANRDTKRGSELVDEHADAVGNDTVALGQNQTAQATIADTMGFLTAAFERQKQAIDDQYASLHKGLDLNLDYEDSIDNLEAALKSNTGTLDIHTEAGRRNIRAAEDARDAIYALMKQTFDETGSKEDAIRAGDLYTENLKRQLDQAGFTKDQVKALIDQVALTPAQVQTIFTTPGLDAALQKTAALKQAIADLSTGSISVQEAANRGVIVITQPGQVTYHAAGGDLTEGVNIVGEAGAEALIKHGNRVTVMPADRTADRYGSRGSGRPLIINQTFNGRTDPEDVDSAVRNAHRRELQLAGA